jgi:RimJ/RimL family protein N-acetyltransferase
MERVEAKKFCFEHLDLFAWREDDLKTYGSRSEITDILTRAAEQGDFWTGVYQGRIVVIGGIVAHTKKTGHCFTLFSEYADQNKIGAARTVKRMFEAMLKAMELHRVVTYNRIGAAEHHKWCEWLGFELEGTVEKFDDDGNNYLQYALIR